MAGVISSVAAPLMATVYVRAHHGFGAGDLGPFVFWSLGLGAFLLATLPLAYRATVRLSSPTARAGLGALVGALSGILFTFALGLGMGPLIGAFSFPILYLWAGAAAFGSAIGALFVTETWAESQRRRKLRWLVGVPMLAITAAAPFGLTLASIYLWGRGEAEVHLLPTGFTGPVVILFDQADGAPPHMEGRARVYEIPVSGVLRTQFRANPGGSARKYFYVNVTGQRSSIVVGAPCDDSLAGDPVQACLEGTLSISNRPTPPYSAYLVGRLRDREVASGRVDSLVRAEVYGESATPPP